VNVRLVRPFLVSFSFSLPLSVTYIGSKTFAKYEPGAYAKYKLCVYAKCELCIYAKYELCVYAKCKLCVYVKCELRVYDLVDFTACFAAK